MYIYIYTHVLSGHMFIYVLSVNSFNVDQYQSLICYSFVTDLFIIQWKGLLHGEIYKQVKVSKLQQQTGIALHMGHDASIALSKNGRIQCTLELERLFNIRYYMSDAQNGYNN